MTASKEIVYRNGRAWTLSKVRTEDAEAEDFRFWYEELTPEQRVDAVYDALESCLKAKGIDAVPRLRRVYRRIKRSGGKIFNRGERTPSLTTLDLAQLRISTSSSNQLLQTR